MLVALGAGRVQVAESGAEALRVVMGTPCGLIIAEHRMKQMDGIEFVRELRQAINYPRALIPVMLLGDPVGADVIRLALEAGANSFVIKPVTPAKLYERVQWTLGDSRPFFVKEGRYVIKPARMTLPEGATRSDIVAARKAAN